MGVKQSVTTVFLWIVFTMCSAVAKSQDTTTIVPDTATVIYGDTFPVVKKDTALRIINLNPYFTLHVDSSLSYQLQVNKNPDDYFWYLKNSPVGLRINKDNGLLTFNAQKSFFLSGKLKYDVNYKVQLGVQNLKDPTDRIDTTFTIVFYNLEIVPSKVKPAISSTIWAEEGETISFKVLCETGSFPIENILTFANMPIHNYADVQQCGNEFKWVPDYDFVKETDSGKVKIVQVFFVGSTRFQVKDTASVKIIVRNALNYPLAKEEYNQVVRNIQRYVLQLKFTFLQLDKKLKRTRTARTTFDLTAATTSLTGTILGTSSSQEAQRTGKILPSVGLAMVPIKEASVPSKSIDQNQASSIRSSIKRLEYVLTDNMLLGEKDWDITRKTNKLKDELKQIQVQLIDVPVELTNELTEEELNRYFNSPRVNKKYRLSTR
ncbi:hypothetical protein [Aridibaculum aurantiacum]|uniref:hypothetical protein n=1 Tax=Aridibaculum aurantiacum TaxID=2810307 RepID=UPI001A95C0BB|nr:hypothetical protein [Aridibaculum aurantiacum]